MCGASTAIQYESPLKRCCYSRSEGRVRRSAHFDLNPYFTSVPGFYECSFMLLHMVWNVLVQSQLADDDSC